MYCYVYAYIKERLHFLVSNAHLKEYLTTEKCSFIEIVVKKGKNYYILYQVNYSNLKLLIYSNR